MKRTCHLLAVTLALCAIALPASAQKNGKANPGVIAPNPQYIELSVAWWQWALSMPIHDPGGSGAPYNPLFDATGAAAANGQSLDDHIFFLAGAMGVILPDGTLMSPPREVTRSITIPSGTRLFVPVFNLVDDNVGRSTPYTPEQLYEEAAGYVATYEGVYAKIDGVDVPRMDRYRVISPVFAYTLPATDNVYTFWGVDISGVIELAVADGYYLLLAPLSVGEHVVQFGGVGFGGGFALDVTYHITVTPGNKK